MRWGRGPLWRNPDFMKFWVGQTISEFGSRLTRDGLPLVAVISLGATATQAGLLAAASTVPVLLLALFAGVWVDRIRRRPVLISSDLARAAVLLLVPVGAWLGFLRIELLIAEGRRIVKARSGPVLDIYAIDYLPSVDLPDASGSGVAAALQRFGLAVVHLAAAIAMVLSARRRAKTTVAKLQLVIGLGAEFPLILSAIFTGLAVLVALGVWTEPKVPDTAADAIALGGAAFTTWLYFSVRPAVRQGVRLLEQMLTLRAG
jgi:MFS family permease